MSKERTGETIKHDGIVEEVGSNSVVVRISSGSACSGCHAEGFCSITGREEKLINIDGTYNVAKGDPISVLMEQTMGFKAVLFGYIFPLLVTIFCLIILITFSVPELTAGLISIGVLIPYFLILYIFRKSINKNFTFKLKT
jgi:sigma-E factor negative regulatory protein RseC